MLILAVSSGCWGQEELTNTGIVVTTGIDLLEGHKYQMTVLAAVPAGGGAMQQPDRSNTWIGSAIGESPMDASKNLRKTATKNLTWVQDDIVIIGEEAARHGIDSIIDYLLRNRETRLNIKILVSKGLAADILALPADIESSLYSELEGGILSSKKWSKSYIPDLREFLEAYSAEYTGSVAGHVGFIDENMVTFSTNREKYMQFDKPFGTQKVMFLEGSTVFKGSSLVGFLSDIETRGFLWVVGKTKIGTLSIVNYEGKGILSAESIGSKSSIEPEVSGDKITFKVKVEAKCRLTESEESIDLNSTATIKKAEKALAESIKKEMEAAVKKAQKEYKSDIFGFGNTLFKKKPAVWRTVKDQWEELYPEVEVSYSVKVTLKRMGETQNGIKAKE